MLKTMKYPPNRVRICMEAICILLDERPTKITDSVKFIILNKIIC